MQPAIDVPADCAKAPESRAEALRELLRSRLSALGPTPLAALAGALQLPPSEVELALLELQAEGYVLQGRLTPGAAVDEWCERHLLARIHRYTLKRLRREIEPVEPRDFVRFLFEWQHVGAAARQSGPEALAGVLTQLEGYEAPAAVWEAELLPARVSDYTSAWLDDLCTAGRMLWTRLRPLGRRRPRAAALSLRSTPILLLPRRQAALWTSLAPAPADDAGLGARAERVAAYLRSPRRIVLRRHRRRQPSARRRTRGRAERAGHTRPGALRQLRRAARAAGAGRKARVGPLAAPPRRRRVRHCRCRTLEPGAARPVHSSTSRASPPDAIEQLARILLRRYGVVCWRLLEREAAWLPPWRELVRVYQRLEARGEIRGGRFIAGLVRRAVRAARGDRADAQAAAPAGRRQPGLPCRHRSGEPARHDPPRAEGPAGTGRARAVPRRRADRDQRRRPGRTARAAQRQPDAPGDARTRARSGAAAARGGSCPSRPDDQAACFARCYCD